MKSSFERFFEELGDFLETGDPTVREFFMIKSKFWPFFWCLLYLLVVKYGPVYMRNRKPFVLRSVMLVYNFFLVIVYSSVVLTFSYSVSQMGNKTLCDGTPVIQIDHLHRIARCAWIVYLLKFVELLDTIFFIMRKKDRLITNLHVIHHFLVPIVGWIFFRTDASGFQAYNVVINCLVHIAMYSYYGLAALGPTVQKYLWWKKYLTMVQMAQFILMFLLTVTLPMMGCVAPKSSIYINIAVTVLFFVLFFNFYIKTFKPRKRRTEELRDKKDAMKLEKSNGTVVNGNLDNSTMLSTSTKEKSQ